MAWPASQPAYTYARAERDIRFLNAVARSWKTAHAAVCDVAIRAEDRTHTHMRVRCACIAYAKLRTAVASCIYIRRQCKRSWISELTTQASRLLVRILYQALVECHAVQWDTEKGQKVS